MSMDTFVLVKQWPLPSPKPLEILVKMSLLTGYHTTLFLESQAQTPRKYPIEFAREYTYEMRILMTDHEHCPKCGRQIRFLDVHMKYTCPHCDAKLIRMDYFATPTICEGEMTHYWNNNVSPIISAEIKK